MRNVGCVLVGVVFTHLVCSFLWAYSVGKFRVEFTRQGHVAVSELLLVWRTSFGKCMSSGSQVRYDIIWHRCDIIIYYYEIVMTMTTGIIVRVLPFDVIATLSTISDTSLSKLWFPIVQVTGQSDCIHHDAGGQECAEGGVGDPLQEQETHTILPQGSGKPVGGITVCVHACVWVSICIPSFNYPDKYREYVHIKCGLWYVSVVPLLILPL